MAVESRDLRRAVGTCGWAVFEDLLLDAAIDERGALVAATNVRRLAANLGVSKDTAARALRRVADAGLVTRREQRAVRGTFATVAYAVSAERLAGITINPSTPTVTAEPAPTPSRRSSRRRPPHDRDQLRLLDLTDPASCR
ncbi:MAG: hypothetical protein ACRDY6_18125 [Acidimicrobiia bacterium]